MGKVRSFFSVLGCPKSNRSRGARNNKRSSKSASFDDIDGVDFKHGNNFSFSENIGEVIGFSEKPEVSLPTEHNIKPDFEDSLYNQKEVAIIALSNTLNLKLRHNLVLAFVCLQKQTIRAHLCRHFVKKVVFILTRNIENSARQAVISLKHHPAPPPPIRDDNVINGIAVLETTLNKLLKRSVTTVVNRLKYGKVLEEAHTPISTRNRQVPTDKGGLRRSSSRRCASSNDSLTGVGRYERENTICPLRSFTTGLSYFVPQTSTREILTTQSTKANCLLENSTAAGSDEVTFKGDVKPDEEETPKLPISSPNVLNQHKPASTGKHSDMSTDVADKNRLSNSIFQRAIKRINVMTPALVTPKTNIVWELDFFTSEPYVNYANKGIICPSASRHDSNF